jgi:hypothetical protein
MAALGIARVNRKSFRKVEFLAGVDVAQCPIPDPDLPQVINGARSI